MNTFVSKWDSWVGKPPETVGGGTDKTDKTPSIRQKLSNTSRGGTDKTDKTLPPPYPGVPQGGPFHPGQSVWLYRWDDHTPRFDTPVTIAQLRTLWPGEYDLGWRTDTGGLRWHNARLAVAVPPMPFAEEEYMDIALFTQDTDGSREPGEEGACPGPAATPLTPEENFDAFFEGDTEAQEDSRMHTVLANLERMGRGCPHCRSTRLHVVGGYASCRACHWKGRADQTGDSELRSKL